MSGESLPGNARKGSAKMQRTALSFLTLLSPLPLGLVSCPRTFQGVCLCFCRYGVLAKTGEERQKSQ